MAELYPARLRYSGISVSHQIAGMVGGAPVPLIATTLLHMAKGSSTLVASYLAAVSLASLIFAGLSSKTRQAFVLSQLHGAGEAQSVTQQHGSFHKQIVP
jgi:hypothetical protein